MAEPRTWVFGDPEPGPDVDAVFFEDSTEPHEREIWWRFDQRWRAIGHHPLAWNPLTYLGKLTEGVGEEFDHHE